MDQQPAEELINKYLAGSCTPEERRLVEQWFNRISAAQEPLAGLPDLESVGKRLYRSLPRPLYRRLPFRIAAAASILLCCGAGLYFYQQQKTAVVSPVAQNDIAPGHNQATLTLANGKKIVLTKGLSGVLAIQGKTTIQATGSDIAYHASQPGDQLNYNTLTTARGEQSPYPLVLADGTKIWLNSASSVTFPTVFNGKERMVKLIGEAYFEVRHNAAQPFKVQTASQVIEDIGTQFDVSAYTDEPNTTTTLVEGRVKVGHLTLQPGEQSDGNSVRPADISAVTAWKNGYFRFHHENIGTIMRQLSRWYNIDVSYQGPQTSESFNAAISRNKNISAVLGLLEGTRGVRFKLSGKEVTVLNK